MDQKFTSSRFRTRYTPTPSGHLHLGNILNFLFTWLVAKQNNAEIYLRIDDIDATRSRDCYIEDIFETLHWLDLDYDFGPQDLNDFKNNFSQLKRIEEYRSYIENNELFYACTCSRKDIQESMGNSLYPGTCRKKNLKYSPQLSSLRVHVEQTYACQSESLFNMMGDFIIWRKDDLPSYQLVSIIDDEKYKINTLVRGQDLIESSCAQRYLAEKLNLKNFLKSEIKFHKLLLDSNGKKLSKSAGDDSLFNMRQKKTKKEDIFQELAKKIAIRNYGDFKNKENFQEYFIENSLSNYLF